MKIEIDEERLRVKITSPNGGFIENQSTQAVLLARLLQVIEGQSNTGLQADTCQSHAWNTTHSGFKFCPDCGQPLARAAKA